VVKKNLLLQLK